MNHDFILHQNYPNPFGEAVPSGNPSTVIKFQIVNNKRQNSSHEVSLKVFDILGREIKILLQKQKSPGNYEVEFNSFGLPSGLYLYQLSSGKFSKTKKMIVIK
ncbi:MAG: T9SS type A sorting domain-containing protein [Bacteroidetes bacterium]|nr:T9SS type A sorting domain-containing protein [Bacteroidota bacterium]MBU2505222.1 T9SS type A sorting domain-containing protein [Bacteroidota bacterium]